MHDCRRFRWFYDKLHLLGSMAFCGYPCTHDVLPRPKDERRSFDRFFMRETFLQALGDWSSFSLNHYSNTENRTIEKFAKDHHCFLSDETLCRDIYAFIGPTDTPSRCIMMPEELVASFVAVMNSFPDRPCLAIFEGCENVPHEVEDILQGKSVARQQGPHGIALSFEIISPEDYKRISKIAHENSKRNRLTTTFYTSASTTTATTMTAFPYSISYSSV